MNKFGEMSCLSGRIPADEFSKKSHQHGRAFQIAIPGDYCPTQMTLAKSFPAR